MQDIFESKLINTEEFSSISVNSSTSYLEDKIVLNSSEFFALNFKKLLKLIYPRLFNKFISNIWFSLKSKKSNFSNWILFITLKSDILLLDKRRIFNFLKFTFSKTFISFILLLIKK